MEVAPIASDGSLGAWTEATPLPSARYLHAAVARGGKLYVIGGQTVSGGSPDVQIAPLFTPAAVGVYSRLFDFGVPVRLDALTVTGASTARGVVRADYRVAGSDAEFGPLQ